MTKVKIIQGVCGFITNVEAVSDEDGEVTVNVESGCGSVRKMFEVLGNTFDGYGVCFNKPGSGPLYEYASEHLPSHCGCIAVAGITKAVEAECKLALPKNASITFE
jgi:hypothetical protein